MISKYIKILIIISIIGFIIYKLKINNEIKNKETKQIKVMEETIENINENQEKEVDSDEIEAMFNLDSKDDKEESVNLQNSNTFVYLDIEYNNNRGRVVINLNNDILQKHVITF